MTEFAFLGELVINNFNKSWNLTKGSNSCEVSLSNQYPHAVGHVFRLKYITDAAKFLSFEVLDRVPFVGI